MYLIGVSVGLESTTSISVYLDKPHGEGVAGDDRFHEYIHSPRSTDIVRTDRSLVVLLVSLVK